MSVQNLRQLLSSRRALLAGEPNSPLARRIAAQLRIDAPQLAPALSSEALLLGVADNAQLLVVFDAGIVTPEVIDALGRNGGTGVLWVNREAIKAALLEAARPYRLRFLGERSTGFFVAGGLQASAFAIPELPGGLALIAQSGSITATAVDWAVGRGIGFTWAVTTGAEADADVADFLDLAALDPQVSAVVLQLGRIGSGRKFMSAARACARLKPVVVLQSQVDDLHAAAAPDPVRSAAFARAGLIECRTLDGLFDALAALARVPQRPQARTLVLGNGAGVCALGVDALARHELPAAALSEASWRAVRQLAPDARELAGGIDTGAPEPPAWVAICRAVLADPGVDYLMLLQSPAAEGAHGPYVDALLEAQLGPRVISVWLGLATAMDARRRCNSAGLATFVTAGQGARALRYRWLHGRTRELLMQTPPKRDASGYDRAAAQAEIDRCLQDQLDSPDAAAVQRILSAYRLPVCGADRSGVCFELELQRHAELGMHLAFRGRTALLCSPTGFAFPPLDVSLIQRMLEHPQLTLAPRIEAGLREALLSLSQIALDLPQVLELRVALAPDESGELMCSGPTQIRLQEQPAPARERLALTPYPDHARQRVRLRNGRHYLIRPILPEDEPALIALLQGLRPEEIRLRFFAFIRYFSHEMAARMTQVDYDREWVLVVEPEGQQDSNEVLCGIAHLISDPAGDSAEYAVLVHHAHAGAGLGRILMQQLLQRARELGLQSVHGSVLSENKPMLALARSLGFEGALDPADASCTNVVIDLSHPPAASLVGVEPQR